LELGPSSLEIEEGPRWSIWIDIEGFSSIWGKGNLAIAGLRTLMSGIFAIGSQAYTDDGKRIFAHQFGDGFVIVGDFHEAALDRCAAIAVVLMRHVATSGCVARAAIAEGDFADYSGCWPGEIRQEIADLQSNDTVRLGSGIMTLLPVMGTALINANKLDSSNKVKGALLTIRTDEAARVSPSFPRRPSKLDAGLSMIDWVHAESPLIEEIVAKAGIGTWNSAATELAVQDYIEGPTAPPSDWVAGTSEFASLPSWLSEGASS